MSTFLYFPLILLRRVKSNLLEKIMEKCTTKTFYISSADSSAAIKNTITVAVPDILDRGNIRALQVKQLAINSTGIALGATVSSLMVSLDGVVINSNKPYIAYTPVERYYNLIDSTLDIQAFASNTGLFPMVELCNGLESTMTLSVTDQSGIALGVNLAAWNIVIGLFY